MTMMEQLKERLWAEPTVQYLFEPHENTEFGKVRVYSRFRGFVARLIAISIIRFPLDATLWAVIFGLGVLVGRRLLQW
jgi:hypothetical protein